MMTVLTDQVVDFSSDDYKNDQVEKPVWVDRVQLRHGMDWLDLTKKEVDMQVNRSLRQTSSL